MGLQLFKPRPPESFYSEANLITVIRLLASLTFFSMAILDQSQTYMYIGFLIHWIVDFIDGWVARRFKQETILGAQADIIADRVEIIYFYVIFLHFRPYIYLPVALYLIDYAFIDFYLGYQFMNFGIISPNYFYKVNKRVYNLNFSPLGKFSNSSIVTILLVFLPQLHPYIAIYACGLIIVKSYSVYLIQKDLARIGRKDRPPV